MNVWLVTIGEPVPTEEGSRDRLHRTGYFARFLAAHGHQVTWWTSTFDHFRKRHLFDEDAVVQAGGELQIRLLHGCGYRSNLSLARFRDHYQIGRKFARLARAAEDRPDIIVAALPTVELCAEAVKFGRQQGVPVVLDMRDMWPDMFVDAVPAPVRPAARLLLWPMFRQARRACAGATAVTGITDAFVDWGLRRGRRARTALDRSFFMGYTSVAPAEEKLRAAEEFWDEHGVTAGGTRPVACFVGTLGRHFELETVLAAAKSLRAAESPLQFVVAGTGDRLEYYRQLCAGLDNVVFPGWVDAAAIHVLMRRSLAGLDPLLDRYDFLATINNKAIEYLSAGLPVISSPTRGELARLLQQEKCGLSYDIGDCGRLATILKELAGDRAQRDGLAENARRVFRERFVAEKVYGDMMAYLEEIAARRVLP